MALRDVNLIPSDVLDRQQAVRHMAVWAVAAAVSVAAVCAGYGRYVSTAAVHRRVPGASDQTHRELASAIAEIQRLQAELEEVSFVGRIRAHRPPSLIFRRLSELMTPGTWLASAAIDSRDTDRPASSLVLTGTAISNTELGALLNSLSGDSVFRDVVLKFTKEFDRGHAGGDDSLPTRVIQFRIDCTVPDR